MSDDPIEHDAEGEDGFHDPALEGDRDDAGSIGDRAGNGDGEELFPLGSLEGDERTLGNLTRGKPTEVTVSLSKAEVPLRGGLLDPSKLSRAVITYEPAKYVEVPIREQQPDGSRKIVSWKIRNVTRAVYAEALPDDPGDLARWALARLIAADPQAAARFADQVQEMVAEYMRSGEPAAV